MLENKNSKVEKWLEIERKSIQISKIKAGHMSSIDRAWFYSNLKSVNS